VGLQYRSFHHTVALNMQIKRLLDDREVHAGDRLYEAQGCPVWSLVNDASEILCVETELISSSMISLSY
jgi:hypothetical protein